MAQIKADGDGVVLAMTPGINTWLREELEKAVRKQAEPLIQTALDEVMRRVSGTFSSAEVYEGKTVIFTLEVSLNGTN
jgi:hypothetical protein